MFILAETSLRPACFFEFRLCYNACVRIIIIDKSMSLNKLEFQPLAEKKSKKHLESWKKETEQSIGRSTRELGIYNRAEVEGKISDLYKNIPKMKEFEFVQEIKEIFPEAGVYVVGGTVRDAVFGKPAKDIDLVVNRIEPVALVEVLLKYGKVTFDRNPKADLAEMNSAEKERLIKDSYGVIKFKPKNSTLPELIDIAFPREDDYSKSGRAGISGIKRDTDYKADPKLDITKDLERRDLTINAMAVNLINGEIADPFDGAEDIVKRKIQTVGDPQERILKEDFSRGFRVIRFACVFSADIENETRKAVKDIFRPADQTSESLYGDKPEILFAVKKYEEEIRELFIVAQGPLPKCLQVFWDEKQEKPRMAVAKEVMSKEIIKAIAANPKHFVELMDDAGGLAIIFPELARLKRLSQPRKYHREGDAFKHTLMLLDHLPDGASLRLKLAALFHDLGKFDTQEVDGKGKISFHGHAQKSVERVKEISWRFHLPAKLTEEISWLVQNHMFPLSSDISRIKTTTLEKMFLGNEELGEDLLALSRADALSSLPEEGQSNLKSVEFLVERIQKIKQTHQNENKIIPPILTGKDLIALGLKPGPEFSSILDQIREAQLDGNVGTKEEAIELAKTIAKVT